MEQKYNNNKKIIFITIYVFFVAFKLKKKYYLVFATLFFSLNMIIYDQNDDHGCVSSCVCVRFTTFHMQFHLAFITTIQTKILFL
jgi:hypothetical protein